MSSEMSDMQQSSPQPKSMRHKRILDVAADDPGASIDDLARAVPTATPDLVERVLNEYGDPAEADGSETATADGDGSETATADGDGSETATADGGESEMTTDGDGGETTTPDVEESEMTTDGDGGETAIADGNGSETAVADGSAATGDGVGSDGRSTETTPTAADPGDTEPTAETGTGGDQFETATATDGTAGAAAVADPAALTPAERETLRAIAANPEATQRALAEELGVSAATVSQRVNGIEGFEWTDRASFVDKMFDTDRTAASEDGESVDQSVAEALTAIEAELETLTEQQSGETPFEDPELVAKIVHACLDAETISTAEELQIIRALVD